MKFRVSHNLYGMNSIFIKKKKLKRKCACVLDEERSLSSLVKEQTFFKKKKTAVKYKYQAIQFYHLKFAETKKGDEG